MRKTWRYGYLTVLALLLLHLQSTGTQQGTRTPDATPTERILDESCKVEVFSEQLNGSASPAQSGFQARLIRTLSDGTTDGGRILYRGEIHKQNEIESKKSKALDACYDHFKKKR